MGDPVHLLRARGHPSGVRGQGSQLRATHSAYAEARPGAKSGSGLFSGASFGSPELTNCLRDVVSIGCMWIVGGSRWSRNEKAFRHPITASTARLPRSPHHSQPLLYLFCSLII